MATKKATKKKTVSKKSASKKSSPKKASSKRPASKKATSKKSATKRATSNKAAPRKWSKHVNETSDAMDLEQGVFKGNDPKEDCPIGKALSYKKQSEKNIFVSVCNVHAEFLRK